MVALPALVPGCRNGRQAAPAAGNVRLSTAGWFKWVFCPRSRKRGHYRKARIISHRCTRMHADEAGVNQLPERVMGCAFRVLDTLGAGILEKVCENALAHGLRKTGLAVARQHGSTVRHDGIVVGTCVADPLAEGPIIGEPAAIRVLESAPPAQCINDLKATGMPLGGCSISANLVIRSTDSPPVLAVARCICRHQPASVAENSCLLLSGRRPTCWLRQPKHKRRLPGSGSAGLDQGIAEAWPGDAVRRSLAGRLRCAGRGRGRGRAGP